MFVDIIEVPSKAECHKNQCLRGTEGFFHEESARNIIISSNSAYFIDPE